MIKTDFDKDKHNFIVIGEAESGKSNFILNLLNQNTKIKRNLVPNYHYFNIVHFRNTIDVNLFEMNFEQSDLLLMSGLFTKDFLNNLTVFLIIPYEQQSFDIKYLTQLFFKLTQFVNKIKQDSEQTFEIIAVFNKFDIFLKTNMYFKKRKKNREPQPSTAVLY